MRLAFAGTPEFSVPALEALIQAGHEIVAVLTQPDRPAGRGRKLRASPVARRAEALGIQVHKPASLKRNPEFVDWLGEQSLDAMVVVAYGLILPQAVLDIPRLGCLNIHASLLPRWRGAAPIQRAILAGDAETGVTIMRMERGLDTGPMLLVDRLPIRADTTAGELHDGLARMGARLIVESLAGLSKQLLTADPQPEQGVTYADKIDKAEARIDWNQTATQVCRQIHAFNPVPGAWTELGRDRIKLFEAQALRQESDANAGQLLSLEASGLVVACRQGAVRIRSLQRAGGRANTPQQAFQGKGIVGQIFGA